MNRSKKLFFKALIIITVLFILFVRTRELFFGDKQQLCNSEYVEQSLLEQTETHENIVPCGWYSGDGNLTPMVAGVCDGGYQAGVAIKDIAVFIARYSSDKQYRTEIDKDLAVLRENKSAVLSLVSQEVKDLGIELSGAKGSAKAEYAYGKVLFTVTTMIVGVGELKTISGLKNTKLFKIIKTSPLAKFANLAKLCPPCVVLIKAAQSLREDLLVTNLAATRKLLAADFVKSGKTWQVFIKVYEAHHIIPVNAFHDAEILHFYYNNGGKLNFNSIENGIMLRKVCLGGSHAKHTEYTKYIGKRLDKLYYSINLMKTNSIESKVQKTETELKKLIEETRQIIINKSINGNIKVNDIFITN